MRKQQRLRKRREFAAVYRRGRFYGHQLVVLRVLKRDEGDTRFGFSAGKAVGKAVVRNRVRRRLREAARSLAVAPGSDVVINARRPAATASYWELRDAMAGLFARASILGESRGAIQE